MTAAYNFERDVLAKCKDRKMNRVVQTIDDGSIATMNDPTAGIVEYLIFELADRDVRGHLARSVRVDTAWKLRSLHHIATGLMQLHSAGIAHQDLKPSNVLVFDQKTSKIGDLGRAAYNGQIGPHDECLCAGDLSYAPPEQLYSYVPADWKKRRFGCDLYLLGSMTFFFFTGLGTSSLLMKELHEAHRWKNWGGSFNEVLPYLREAFGRVVNLFSVQVDDDKLVGDLRMIVSQLCDPDPDHRGLPPSVRGIGSPYSLERYVARFDLLSRRAEIGLRR
jgi:eukaryotic-like serine/threonine-protein kinase